MIAPFLSPPIDRGNWDLLLARDFHALLLLHPYALINKLPFTYQMKTFHRFSCLKILCCSFSGMSIA